MSNNIEPVLLIQKMKKGHSKPHLIRFTDGNDYVVKFKNNPTGTRTLVNEYVAGKLAVLVNLPVTPFRIVYISQNFIEANPSLFQSGFRSGNQFASLFITDTTYLPQKMDPDHPIPIMNKDQLAGIIAFDYWLGNVDRNRKNLLLKPIQDTGFQFFIIDHGHCFTHSNWTVETLKTIPNMSNSWRKAHKHYISMLEGDGLAGVAEHITKIIAIHRNTIEEIVNSIPADWEVSDLEREALIEFLIESQQRLHHFRIPVDGL
ncbi:HipA family kinase [Bacillus salipaludis]|uniref:HipA family kinase n=1 Tax=Bacillus salipaludis TaxID=2547811 RepID=A0ABW8RMK9_9BACI